MLDWWNALSGLEQIFYIIAIPATLISAADRARARRR